MFTSAARRLRRPATTATSWRASASFQDAGKLEIITCGATHGFLPLMEIIPNAVRAQIAVARESYATHFGRDPARHLAAECGYYPGPRRGAGRGGHPLLLRRHPRRALRRAAAQVRRVRAASTARPASPRSGATSSRPSRSGAPRKAIPATTTTASSTATSASTSTTTTSSRTSTRRHAHQHRHQVLPDHRARRRTRSPTTARVALDEAAQHAGNFMFNREQQVEYLAGADGPPAAHRLALRRRAVRPLVVRGAGVPQLPVPQDPLRPERHSTCPPPASTSSATPSNQVADAVACRAGATRATARSGWTAPTTGSTATCTRPPSGWSSWRNQHRDAGDPLTVRALNQAARELLLAQSSDWAFIMKTGTMVEYAVKRTKDHILRVHGPLLHDPRRRDR